MIVSVMKWNLFSNLISGLENAVQHVRVPTVSTRERFGFVTFRETTLSNFEVKYF